MEGLQLQRKSEGSRWRRQQGFALLLALLAVVLLSILVAALLILTKTEVWSTLNYRQTVQARYVAEAGAQSAINYLVYNYTQPTAAQLANYDLTKSPVQDIATHNPIALSGLSGIPANYPDASAQTAFNTAFSNQSVPGISNATYSAAAELLEMRATTAFGGGNGYLMKWQITSQGNVGGVRNAQVQLVETIARTGTPVFKYGLVGLGTQCGDITFTGGTMDSWNSSTGTYAATQQNSGGDIATNGNVTLSGGSTRVYGTMYDSTNINVGNCPSGITDNVGGTPWNGLSQLSKSLTYPGVLPPSPMTPNTNQNANSNTCWGASPAGCSVGASAAACNGGTAPCVNIVPGSYGNITSNSRLHLTAGIYNINSLNLNGGALILDSWPVTINLGGNGITSGGTLFASQSSTVINTGAIPANLLIESAAGSGLANPPVITMNAASALYAAVYAPSAYVHITGSSQFFGAVVSYKATSDSSGGFHYDQGLKSLQMLGPYLPVSFSWSRY